MVSIVVALMFVFTLCLYAPVEIYLTNITEFWFSIQMLLAFVVPISIILFIVAESVLIVIEKKAPTARLIFEKILFFIGVCFYIQGNYIVSKVGQFNPYSVLYSQARNAKVDTMLQIYISNYNTNRNGYSDMYCCNE